MGLTIYYTIRSKETDRKAIKTQLKAARELANDLAFEHVGRIFETTKIPDDPRTIKDPGKRWALCGAGVNVVHPWTVSTYKYPGGGSSHHGRSTSVKPLWVAGFICAPGAGSEPLDICVAEYPETVTVEYSPQDDVKFMSWERISHETQTRELRWDVKKSRRWRARHPSDFGLMLRTEQRVLPVRSRGYSACCKTQYASEFGMHHFVRCHLSVCHLLKRMRKLGFKVDINDEGHYERACYSDDWREAAEERREPTYVWHKPTYDVKELVKQCGEYNKLVAVLFGGFKDLLQAAGSEITVDSPISAFSDFEMLEAKGCDEKHVSNFIAALAAIPKLKPAEAQ